MRTGIGSDRIETDVFFFFSRSDRGFESRWSQLDRKLDRKSADGRIFFLATGPFEKRGKSPEKSWLERTLRHILPRECPINFQKFPGRKLTYNDMRTYVGAETFFQLTANPTAF